MFNGEKLNKVISMGHPNGLNYSYNLEQGAILQVWRGNFMDVTDMWHHRGHAQLAKPLGNTVSMSNSPSIAVLSDFNALWPDSITSGIIHEGYTLDKNGIPRFTYKIGDFTVGDKIVPLRDETGFERTLTVNGKLGSNLYCRVISATLIEQISKEMFRVNGSYYVIIDKKFQPKLRETKNSKELLVDIDEVSPVISYSIIY